MCPVCGTPLELATEAPQAQRERALIQRLMDDCRSKDEIKSAWWPSSASGCSRCPATRASTSATCSCTWSPASACCSPAAGSPWPPRRWRRRGGSASRRRAAPSAAAGSRLDADLDRYDL